MNQFMKRLSGMSFSRGPVGGSQTTLSRPGIQRESRFGARARGAKQCDEPSERCAVGVRANQNFEKAAKDDGGEKK